MAVRPRGQVVERYGKSGRTYAIRFYAYGRRRYLTLGRESEGWIRRQAEDELANVLADVRRDLWVEQPPGTRRRHRKQRREIPFAVFADDLLAERRPQLSKATCGYLEWGLQHLRPFFRDWLLRDIDVEAVDAYCARKVQDAEALEEALERGRPRRDGAGRIRQPLSPSSINKTIDVLQWLLSAAEEYGWIDSNPARGRRRRLRKPKRLPVYLDSVEQIKALLEAADELDTDPRFRIDHRLPLIATLVFAGLRATSSRRFVGEMSGSPQDAFRFGSPRRKRACVRLVYSRSSAAFYGRIGNGPAPSGPMPWSLRLEPDGNATRTTSEAASLRRQSVEQTRSSGIGAAFRFPTAFLLISYATPSPRFSSPVAKTLPR